MIEDSSEWDEVKFHMACFYQWVPGPKACQASYVADCSVCTLWTLTVAFGVHKNYPKLHTHSITHIVNTRNNIFLKKVLIATTVVEWVCRRCFSKPLWQSIACANILFSVHVLFLSVLCYCFCTFHCQPLFLLFLKRKKIKHVQFNIVDYLW